MKSMFFSDQDMPRSMLQLHRIAESEKGWLKVVHSLISKYEAWIGFCCCHH